MGTYITYSDVVRTCGISTNLMTSTDMELTINDVEKYTERWLNCKFAPTVEVDILDGKGTSVIILGHNPLLSVRSLTSDGDTILPTEIFWYKDSGKIEISSVSSTAIFSSVQQSNIIKYIHGFVEYSSTGTTSTVATIAGTSIAISVSSTSGFTTGDWVEIYGTDGFREAAQITVGTGILTADQLVLTHASGSFIKKLEMPKAIKRFLELEASISCLMKIIGSTYSFKSNYSLGELGITKTGPFQHYSATLQNIILERNRLIGELDKQGIIKPRPYIVSS
jgi:hypothetical protein